MTLDTFKNMFEAQAAEFDFDDWELHGICTQSLEATVRVDERPSITRSQVCGVALRVLHNGKIGVSFTERLDEHGACFLAKAAQDMIRFTDTGVSAKVFTPDSGIRYQSIDNYDPVFENEDYVIDLATTINEYVCQLDLSMRQFQSTNAKVDNKQVVVVNSRGVNLAHKYNYLTLFLHPTASQGGKMRESEVFASVNLAGGPNIKALCTRAVETARDYLTADVPESGTYSVVFRNSIATHLIQGFAIFFCGEQVSKKISLVADKMGEQVASSALTVIDDPLLPEGILSCPFDAQGVPTRKKVVIENGILRSFMHNLDTAAAVGSESTGNAWRISYNHPLEAAPCNIYIMPGKYNEQELFEMLGDGIYITRLVSTFHGAGVNAVSGDFSMPARGFKIKNGKKCDALELFTISGNYYDLIRNIRACGNDLLFGPPNMLIPGAPAEYGNYGSPAVLVDGISVAGK